jgi:excisionase family DNA binding protein
MSESADQDRRFSGLNEPLLTPRDVAELLSVRVSWIYSAVREGRMPCVRLGRHIRFVRTQLEHFVLDQGGTQR